MFQNITQIIKKQVILLTIPNREKWHYLAVKKLSALLREITSKHHRYFYCLNCLHSFVAENKHKSHKKQIIKPSEDTKILEFNQYQISDKTQFIIYADLKCIKDKTGGCKNNLENSSITKVSEHIPSDFSMSISSFKNVENKHDVYSSRDCMKKFCESLREHAMKIVNFKKENEVLKKRAAESI